MGLSPSASSPSGGYDLTLLCWESVLPAPLWLPCLWLPWKPLAMVGVWGGSGKADLVVAWEVQAPFVPALGRGWEWSPLGLHEPSFLMPRPHIGADDF